MMGVSMHVRRRGRYVGLPDDQHEAEFQISKRGDDGQWWHLLVILIWRWGVAHRGFDVTRRMDPIFTFMACRNDAGWYLLVRSGRRVKRFGYRHPRSCA